MTTEQQLTRFLVENLVSEDARPVTPALVDDSEVFQADLFLWDLWDILHWTTQSEICKDVNSFFDSCFIG